MTETVPRRREGSEGDEKPPTVLPDGRVADPAPVDAGARSPDLLRVLTSIGSPIALATALLFYFGWVRSEVQAEAFGADASVFAMSTQDYVLRSGNVLLFPVILLLLLGLLAPRVDHWLRGGAVPAGRLAVLARVLRWSWAVFLPAGLLLLGTGDAGAAVLPLWILLAILGPVYGTVLGRAATGPTQRNAPRTTAILLALVTVCLFWQTDRFARFEGTLTAQDIQDQVGDPGGVKPVTLYSAKDLRLGGPGITTTRSGDPLAAYRFTYRGLYLLQRSGGKYFLVTAGWGSHRGRLVVLPDDPTTRLEFSNRPAG